MNAATQTVEALAPNAIATLYGTNLSYTTRAVSTSDLAGGALPTTLDGVAVWVNAIPSGLFFVSPTQINFLVPYDFTAGKASVIVARQAIAGPSVKIQLNNTSPGLFLWNGNNAVAVHLNGKVISPMIPATAGEIIVIYAGGLGRTTPHTTSGGWRQTPPPSIYVSQLQILLNGVPYSAGQYSLCWFNSGLCGVVSDQLECYPPDLDGQPEIRVAIGAQVSPPSIQLAVQ